MYQQDGSVPTQQFAPMAQAPATLPPTGNIARVDVRPNMQTLTQSAPGGVALASSPNFKRTHPNLNQYLVDHNQLAPRLVVQGVLPYARIVAIPRNPHKVPPTQK
jgi:hypothetical protein